MKSLTRGRFVPVIRPRQRRNRRHRIVAIISHLRHGDRGLRPCLTQLFVADSRSPVIVLLGTPLTDDLRTMADEETSPRRTRDEAVSDQPKTTCRKTWLRLALPAKRHSG